MPEITDAAVIAATAVALGLPPLDVPPLSPSAYDDEFAGSVLDAKWTKNPIVTANAHTAAVANGQLTITPNDYTHTCRLYGIAQVETGGGSFKVSARISAVQSGVDVFCGVLVGVTGGKGHVFGSSPNNDQFGRVHAATSYNEGGSDWSNYDGFSDSALAPNGFYAGTGGWYRIRWNAATSTLYFDYSTDGNQWRNWTSRGAMSQPNRIGLAMYAQGNPGWTAAAGLRLNARWFRYEANATL